MRGQGTSSGASPELVSYFYKRKNWKLFGRVLTGEGLYWSVVGLGLWLRPEATLTVLVVPLVLIRTLMMMGNWTQHSFISQEHPEDPFQSSITCINTRQYGMHTHLPGGGYQWRHQ